LRQPKAGRLKPGIAKSATRMTLNAKKTLTVLPPDPYLPARGRPAPFAAAKRQ
jgi:hypothetical protein